MWKKTLFNVAKVVLLAFFIFTISNLLWLPGLWIVRWPRMLQRRCHFKKIEQRFHLLALILGHTTPDLVMGIEINEQALAVVFMES